MGQAEGIPNILGQIAGVYNSYTRYDGQDYKGAFEQTTYGGNDEPIAAPCDYDMRVRTLFNAALGENHNGYYYNNVYGKSDHVTPLSISVIYWKRLQ